MIKWRDGFYDMQIIIGLVKFPDHCMIVTNYPVETYCFCDMEHFAIRVERGQCEFVLKDFSYFVEFPYANEIFSIVKFVK